MVVAAALAILLKVLSVVVVLAVHVLAEISDTITVNGITFQKSCCCCCICS